MDKSRTRRRSRSCGIRDASGADVAFTACILFDVPIENEERPEEHVVREFIPLACETCSILHEYIQISVFTLNAQDLGTRHPKPDDRDLLPGRAL